MKKNIFAVFIFSLFVGSLCGQMVYTDPAVPTNGRVIKIFYDSSKDNGTLKNYTGDIYVHTGVTVNGVMAESDRSMGRQYSPTET